MGAPREIKFRFLWRCDGVSEGTGVTWSKCSPEATRRSKSGCGSGSGVSWAGTEPDPLSGQVRESYLLG